MNEKEIPQVRIHTTDYIKDIDEILNNVGVHDIILCGRTIDTVEDIKQAVLNHPECNTILGLLKEFYELSQRLDNLDDWKMRDISNILIQIDSPVILYLGE